MFFLKPDIKDSLLHNLLCACVNYGLHPDWIAALTLIRTFAGLRWAREPVKESKRWRKRVVAASARWF
jgi:hypothetical protein